MYIKKSHKIYYYTYLQMYICVYIPILQERGKDFTIIKGSFIGSRHDNKKSNSSAVFSNES